MFTMLEKHEELIMTHSEELLSAFPNGLFGEEIISVAFSSSDVHVYTMGEDGQTFHCQITVQQYRDWYKKMVARQNSVRLFTANNKPYRTRRMNKVAGIVQSFGTQVRYDQDSSSEAHTEIYIYEHRTYMFDYINDTLFEIVREDSN